MSSGRGVSRAGGVADVLTRGSMSWGRGVSRGAEGAGGVAFWAIATDEAAATPSATIIETKTFTRMTYPLPGAGCAGAGWPAGGVVAGTVSVPAGAESLGASVGAASGAGAAAGLRGTVLPVR